MGERKSPSAAMVLLDTSLRFGCQRALAAGHRARATTLSSQRRYHFFGQARQLPHIQPGWRQNDALSSRVDEVLNLRRAFLGGAKNAGGIDVVLRTIIGVREGTQVIPAQDAVFADVDVQELARLEGGGVFAAGAGIRLDLLPGLMEGLG